MENSLIPANTRSEFEHHIYLVVEDAERKIASGNEDAIGALVAFTFDDLKRLRAVPNGRVNLLTITESLRLQANMQNQMQHWRPENNKE